MTNICKFIGHKRETLIFIDDDRKYVVFTKSDCLRCGKPSDDDPVALSARRDPIQKTRLLPCPLCSSPVHLVGTDCYPEEGIEVECDSPNCEYSLSLSLHSCSPVPSLKPAVTQAHNLLWGAKKC